jgi:DNA topoisomerase-1
MARKSSKASPKTPAVAADGEAGVAVQAPPKGGGGGRGKGKFARRMATTSYKAGAGKDKHLVIVESPSKAKTINKYLGKEYLVLASVGHVRDLPSRNPKGVKNPVPGVDLEKDFKPTYEISEGKERVIADLKRAAKEALGSGHEVWFATDLDREGEAIAWHLAQELGIKSSQAKRVVFPAITKAEIEKAFQKPHPIDEDRVNAQQARRILDRIVGYQVSPLLWKKVARGLSAGRVQSVAVRLVVDREREIRAFIPDEYWEISANFTAELAKAAGLAGDWTKLLSKKDEKGNPPTLRQQGSWLAENGGFHAELIEYAGEKFEVRLVGAGIDASSADANEALGARALEVAQAAGLKNIKSDLREEPPGRGSARWVRTVRGELDTTTPYSVSSVETKRTTSRPGPPYITSTLQQAASSRLGFNAQRTMRTAQQLYEGIEIPGEGPVGLITYMRTDSTHLSGESLEMARGYIQSKFGDKYLPEKANVYSSSNKDAQEAHEAIRPTDVSLTPMKVRNSLTPDQARLYQIIWERFVSCQMVPAQWDSTTALITGGRDAKKPCTFRASGRVLVFDGFYKVSGVPLGGDEQNLPRLAEQTKVAPFAMDVDQKFTAPPPRYSEASLIKMLESEGIGRPSTYASIIGVIQDRKYVEQENRRFFATDLGEVVTDKLIEAFPEIMDVGYTRDMEKELDKVEEDHIDWVQMLHRFYNPFKKALKDGEKNLVHAKAETVPAPEQYRCPECGSSLVYRFGKNGRFLSCSTYPDCTYASPVDREGVPRPAAETVDIACPKCGNAMTKRVGRFGPFLGCSKYNDKKDPCDGILNLDKKGKVKAPSMPALLTELPCDKCQAPLNLRNGVRGPWLSCSRFPKCRGRGKWNDIAPEPKAKLEEALHAHEKANPIPIIKTMAGKPLTDATGKPLADALPVGQNPDTPETLESVADEIT